MAGLTDKEKEALALFRQQLFEQFANQVDEIGLFGSKARGEATKFSDIDVLVVTKDGASINRHDVSGITADILFETNVVISPKVFSLTELADMKKRRSMFWQSIEPDLVQL